ncbi:MAG: porin [Pseudomonadota bacterium]
MTHKLSKVIVLSVLCAAALSAPATAIDLTGAYLSGSHAAFTDRDTIRKTGVHAGAEFTLNERYGLQFDTSAYQFEEAGTAAYNVAAHVIMRPSDTLALGAFIGTERVSNQSAGYYGIEAAVEKGPIRAQAYASQFIEGNARSAATFGLSATASLTDRVDLGLDYGRFEITGTRDVSRHSVKAGYQINARTSLTAEYGKVELGSPFGNLDDNFVSLGVTMHFGTAGRTTFRQRGLSTILPGG